MNCRHCGAPNPKLPLDSNPAEWICTQCGAQLFSQDLLETRAMASSEWTRFEMPNRFRADKVAGEGSFGIVSKCWDTVLQRDVAVKFPKDGNFRQDLFLREARAASRLQHENIVRIFDVGEHQGHAFIVSEFVEGPSLGAWLNRKSRTVDEMLRMMIKIARSIDYAHKAGVIHRDLKPGNILVNHADEPRVLDFGLSRSRYGGEDTIMKPGQQIGTPAFMAPEQVRGEVDGIDETTDVYALGVILFQMLVHQLPYSGSVHEVYEAITEEVSPPSLRSRDHSIPAPLESICLKAIAKHREDRYQSAGAFADDIERYLLGQSVSVYRGLHSRRVKSVVRRNWLAWAAIVFAVIAFGGWGWIYLDGRWRNPVLSVVIETVPPEANLVWTRFDPALGLPADEPPVKSVAGKIAWLNPGFYRVVAFSKDDSVEVFRTVPESAQSALAVSVLAGKEKIEISHRASSWSGNNVVLPDIRIVPVAEVSSGMAFMPGGTISVASDPFILPAVSGQSQSLAGYLIDTNEITWQQILDTWPEYQLPEGQLREMTALGVSWDIAAAWAEKNGKSLPSVWELQFASTNGNTTQYPWGDELPEVPATAGPSAEVAVWDQSRSTPQICGLFSGRNEWAEDPFVMLMMKEGQLIPFKSPGTFVTGEAPQTTFPSSFYVYSNVDFSEQKVHRVFGNLVNASCIPLYPNLGFRTVRRLHTPDSK